MNQIQKEVEEIVIATRNIKSKANNIAKHADTDAENIKSAIANYIKCNAKHINPENCSEFEGGFYQACEGMLKAIDNADLVRLLVDPE